MDLDCCGIGCLGRIQKDQILPLGLNRMGGVGGS